MADLMQTLQCSVTAAALALHREPRLLTVGRASLAQRVLALRAAAPRADLTRLCLICPRLLASPDEEIAYFTHTAAKMRAVLPGCEWLDLMAQEDPELLLCNVDAGLSGLTSLWTAQQLATMDAEEAALAIRALCGLPRKGVVPGWQR